MFRPDGTKAWLRLAFVALAGCATVEPRNFSSQHVIIGPKGYTVDWGLPETGYYWIPTETENDIKATFDACGAPPSVFVYHHIPRPPWFSYFGIRFEPGVDERARTCVVTRLKAVPSLTVYPKRR